MTTEHTPGPWIVTEDPMSNQDYQTLVTMPERAGVMGTWLALVHHNWNEAEAGKRRISWKEAEANARLIAASPELLTQLEWAESVLKWFIEGSAQIESLRATIAKAKGAS